MKYILILAVLVMLPFAYAADLAEFPEMFINEGSPNAVIVMGKAADAEDVVGAINIAMALQYAAGESRAVDPAKLDNEIKDLSAQNTIIIGGPCANAAAAKVLGYPENCMDGFQAGKGLIKLYEWDNGKVAMLVAGALAIDTRRAALVLADYASYNLTGTSMEVTGFAVRESIVK